MRHDKKISKNKAFHEIDKKKIIIPIIKRTMPKIIESEIVNAQPISDEVGDIFLVKDKPKPIENKFGDVVHNFISGWVVYDGNNFINFIEFIDKYGTENIEANMKEKLSQWYYNHKAGIK